MLKSHIVNSRSMLEWFSLDFFRQIPVLNPLSNVLSTTDHLAAYARFASQTRTTAGTTNLVTPISGGSLILLDLIIGGEKQAASTTEVRFTDGSNTATVFLASQVDAPPNLAHTFRGRVQGWKDARIDMITSGAGDATVMVTYVKLNEGLSYANWDALR